MVVISIESIVHLFNQVTLELFIFLMQNKLFPKIEIYAFQKKYRALTISYFILQI